MKLTYNDLISEGLTNRDSEDLGALAVDHYFHAFCTSMRCRKVRGKDRNPLTFIRKHVSRHAVECPDCHHSLFWRRVEAEE